MILQKTCVLKHVMIQVYIQNPETGVLIFYIFIYLCLWEIILFPSADLGNRGISVDRIPAHRYSNTGVCLFHKYIVDIKRSD